MNASIAIAVLAALNLGDVANPRASQSWTTDKAGLFSAAEIAAINTIGDRLKATIGIELAVVTVEGVGRPVRPFAVDLFNRWGVGEHRYDNGLMFFISKSERALESVTGDGMDEVLTDSWLKAMQDRVMVPRFKQRDFGGGVIAGLAEIERFLATEAAGEAPTLTTDSEARAPSVEERAPRPAAGGRADNPASADDQGGPWGLIGAGAAGALGLGGIGFFGYRRRRKLRVCARCQREMIELDEIADDAHLDAGQRHEERIGSVNYYVFYCHADDHAQIARKGRWFTGYKKCPACTYKARTVTSTTIQSATYSSSGLREIVEDCSHCSYHSRSTRTIPMLVESSSSSDSSSSSGFSSSSSGSSGGSYGGGSSSGGGASSSW